ncbi:MAG: ABC transporter permease [Fimbriimonadaceae bacterium]|nr:ABC transporter permease [Fimbriimonadaceae bacterium]
MEPAAPAAVSRAWLGRFLHDAQGLSGLLLVAALLLAALLAPWLTPFDPHQQYEAGLTPAGMPATPGTVIDLSAAGGPASAVMRLGADNLGRDLLTRLLFGARISLAVGLAAMATAIGIGALVGLLAGYFRGRVELLLMRLTDMMLTIPTLVLAIALASLLPKTPLQLGGGREFPREILNLFIVIGLVNWTGVARIIRGETLRQGSMEYVEAARALGCGHGRILFRHVLPNVLPTIVVLGSLTTANTILLDAGLSYLGIGTPPPYPSWGAMINDGQPYLLTAKWLILGPGLCAMAAVLGFNLLGQGLQNALDPWRRG